MITNTGSSWFCLAPAKWHSLYSFPVSAIKNDYERGVVISRNLFSHSSGGQKFKTKLSAGPYSLSGSRGEISSLSLGSFLWLLTFLDLQAHHHSPCLRGHLSTLNFCLLLASLDLGLIWRIQDDLFLLISLIYSSKGPFSN